MVKNSPKDKGLLIEYASVVAETGHNAGACERALNEFMRNSPYDTDLVQAQKNLSAQKTMNEGGYGQIEGGKASYRDILRNKEESVSMEQENRVQKSDDVTERLIGEYEERLHTEPDNLRLLRQLAELYTQKSRFDEALEVYGRIKGSEMGSDATLDRAITETTVRRFNYQIEQLDPALPESAEQAARLAAEKLAYQMSDCQQRVEKYPTDMAIRFEMGQLYLEAGKIAEATAEFQKAQGNPHKRIAAMSYLAQCFSRRKMYDMAARKLQEALKEKPGFDEEKKDLIYQLGSVLETMGKKEEAIEQFKIIYEMDISYRDVGAKVDAYYASQG
jgi:tetratricopeptide (TPR) repeat protein